MYKAFKLGRFRLTFNKFRKTAKKLHGCYRTGFRCWEAFEDYNYSIVLGTFRIIVSIDKRGVGECSG